jgi:hypothetical protein
MSQAVDVRLAREADAALVSSILVEAASWIASRGLPLWPIEQLSVEALGPSVAAGSYILEVSRRKEWRPRGSLRMIPSAGRTQSLALQCTCTESPFAERGLDAAWRA